jgi:cobalt/nickel transport system permease protein
MMVGHLTVAGIAELIVSAGVVAFVQRSDPALLEATGGGARATAAERVGGVRGRLRPLWLGLGVILMLTPLGILAGGSAWGEWAASDFSNPAAREAMANASLSQRPPVHPPQGLARLASVWTAPLAGYAPPWIGSSAVGYLLSAMFGAGLVILVSLVVTWIARRRPGGAIDTAAP